MRLRQKLEVVVKKMVYRKTLDGKWICSWNCGFEHYDLGKVAEHETEIHGNKKSKK
jgi:hypothetical protein